MRKIFALNFLILLFLTLAPSALAEGTSNPPVGWLQGRSGLAPFDADYFTLSTNTTLTNERVLTFSTPQFAVSDNGAGNTYAVTLGPILSYWYSTGATSNQTAFNAISTLPSSAIGDTYYKNGAGTITRLGIGSNGDVYTVSGGIPSWVTPAFGAPQGAHYVTTQTDADLTNEHVISGGDGIDATIGAGTCDIAVDSTVIRTTGAQSMSGPKTLSGGPIVTGAHSTGLVLTGSSFSTTLLTDPGANRNQTIPDVASGSFVMTQGASTKVGVLTLSASPVLSTDTITGSGANTVTLFTSSDTVVGRNTSDVLTNKELTSPSLTNNATGLTMKGSGLNTFVHTWAPGATGQTLTWPNPNGNVDVGYKTGALAAGGILYGIGNNTFSASAAGTTGQVPVSAGAGAVGWGVAPIAGGGTNNGSLAVTAGVIPRGDGSKLLGLALGTGLQQLRVNAGATDIEWATPTAGTVTSFSATPSGVFDVATATTTPVLSLDNQSANVFLSGPASGSATTPSFRVHAINDYINFPICNGGRLTLTSATPVADAGAQPTLYWTPYKHGVISLWDGSQYVNVLPGEKSLSLTLTSGNVYEVWGYLSGGTLALETLVWTNTTTRATGLTVDSSGVTHKTGDQSRRWLGTLYASGTNQCTDNASIRGLFNADNRVMRQGSATDTTDSWTYTTATIREANGSSTNGVSRCSFLLGNANVLVSAVNVTNCTNSNATNINTAGAIGLDSSSTQATDCHFSYVGTSSVVQNVSSTSTYSGLPGLGLHDLRRTEYSAATGTTTWYGDAAGAIRTGLKTWIEM